MIPTALIAFREYLEAFLLIGVLLGLNKNLQLGKQKEIYFASGIGILISFFLPITVFLFAIKMHIFLAEKNTDIAEGYLLTFSGFFLAYVIFSLHKFMNHVRDQRIATKMNEKIFDIALFFTIILFIIREGFEISLMTSTISLFSELWLNITGLCFGFIGAAGIGTLTTITYVQLPVKKVFRYTEYLIILLGAAMVKNGFSILIHQYTSIRLEMIVQLPVQFLPDDTTLIGHMLNTLFGLQPKLGIIQIGIMILYILWIYLFWLRKVPALHT